MSEHVPFSEGHVDVPLEQTTMVKQMIPHLSNEMCAEDRSSDVHGDVLLEGITTVKTMVWMSTTSLRVV
jgi:hypothetical protein